jgi:hypothetical protein
MILENGRVFADGRPQLIVREYHKLLFDTPGRVTTETARLPGSTIGQSSQTAKNASAGDDVRTIGSARHDTRLATNHSEVRYGTGEAYIRTIGLRDYTGSETGVIEANSECEAYFQAVFPAPVATPIAYGFIISNARGVEVYGTKSGLFATTIRATEEERFFECRLRFVTRLVPGRYFLTAALAHDDGREEGQFLDFRFDAFEFQVIGTTRAFTTSLIDLEAQLGHISLGKAHA